MGDCDMSRVPKSIARPLYYRYIDADLPLRPVFEEDTVLPYSVAEIDVATELTTIEGTANYVVTLFNPAELRYYIPDTGVAMWTTHILTKFPLGKDYARKCSSSRRYARTSVNYYTAEGAREDHVLRVQKLALILLRLRRMPPLIARSRRNGSYHIAAKATCELFEGQQANIVTWFGQCGHQWRGTHEKQRGESVTCLECLGR